jgi:hypothetical protein
MTIDEICKKYKIKNYTINPDGSIDVDDDVNLDDKNLTELPLTFNKVTGSFSCRYNYLTSLKGGPKWVGRDFSCYSNQLTSLEDCPKWIGRWFSCGYNRLTSLEFSPDYVGGYFNCGDNDLTDLVGSPKEVGGFNCNNNPNLINSKGVSEKIGREFICSNTPLSSIFNGVDQFFLHAFNFYRVIKGDTVNLKRLKYVMDLYDKPIDLKKIERYYRIV